MVKKRAAKKAAKGGAAEPQQPREIPPDLKRMFPRLLQHREITGEDLEQIKALEQKTFMRIFAVTDQKDGSMRSFAESLSADQKESTTVEFLGLSPAMVVVGEYLYNTGVHRLVLAFQQKAEKIILTETPKFSDIVGN